MTVHTGVDGIGLVQWPRAAYERIVKADVCAYCGGRPSICADHIVSRHQGGADAWENYTGSCDSCNATKHNLSLLAFLGYRRHRAAWAADLRREAYQRSTWRAVGA